MSSTRPYPIARAARTPLLLSAVAGMALALGACGDDPLEAQTVSYEVTVSNTAGALQPLSPPVVVLHAPDTRVFESGSTASAELERVAESGNAAPLSNALSNDSRVAEVATGDGPITPGNSATFTLEGPAGMRISVVSMLVCTNDGFVGLDSAMPPAASGGMESYALASYDAGTEQNTEASTDLVPPCVMATTGSAGGTGDDQPDLAEGGTIELHGGINADTDGDDILEPATHQWSDPAARVEVSRTG